MSTTSGDGSATGPDADDAVDAVADGADVDGADVDDEAGGTPDIFPTEYRSLADAADVAALAEAERAVARHGATPEQVNGVAVAGEDRRAEGRLAGWRRRQPDPPVHGDRHERDGVPVLPRTSGSPLYRAPAVPVSTRALSLATAIAGLVVAVVLARLRRARRPMSFVDLDLDLEQRDLDPPRHATGVPAATDGAVTDRRRRDRGA